MKDQFLEPNSGNYLTLYRAVADANPAFTVGSSAAEMFQIQAIYTSRAQTLARVDFVETSTLATIWRFVVGVAAGDDWSIYDGTNNLVLVEGDTTRITLRLDGGANSDFAITNAATDMIRVESDGAMTFTPTTAFAVVIGTDTGDDFTVNDGSIDRIHVDGDANSILTGDWTFADGAYDFDIASHDGTNGLMLAGTLVTTAATELNSRAAITLTTVDQTALFTVGRLYTDSNGDVFVYLQGVTNVLTGWVVSYIVTTTGAATTAEIVANAVGNVGVAMAAVIGGDFGWFQVAGLNLVTKCDGSAAIGQAYIGGTTGGVDHNAVAGDRIDGMQITVADSSNVCGVYLTYPSVNDATN